MSYIWAVLLFSAVVAGASFVAVLVVRRHAEFMVAVAGVGSFGLAAYSLFAIATIYERADAVMYAFAFFAAGIVGGWSLASSLLDRLATKPTKLSAPATPPDDNESTAVIVLSCTEPRVYDPTVTAGSLRTLSDEGMIEPSITTLPFMIFAQKTRYRAIGGTSPAAGELIAIAERLERALANSGVTRVDVAGCSGARELSARVLDAVEAGYRTVVVSALAVAESAHQSSAKQRTDALRLEALGVRILYAEGLGTADRLVEMLRDRVLATVADKSDTGVVLVGHGQPEARAKRYPRFDEEETAFLSRVRMSLIGSGVLERSIRVAWAEWRSPDVTSAVRHLAALGCRRVIVLPGAFAVDTIGTRLDLEMAVRQARVEDSVSVVTLPAWSDDEAVIGEMADRVIAELADQAT
jgi:protoheme ferro-lyase